MTLSKARRRFIDDTFFERDDYTFEQFSQLQSSAELHYLMQQHNWDGDNRLLQWLADSPLCSAATALEMFWLAQPQDYQCYPLGRVLPDEDEQANFQLIQTLMTRYVQGFYAEGKWHFDPAAFWQQDTLDIPDSLYQPSLGETPYVYWEAEEVAGLFGEAFEHALRRSEHMDVYNLALLLRDYQFEEAFWPLLNHPLCERGMAQMLFWRLYSSRFPFSQQARRAYCNEFIHRWQAGDWAKAAIAYDPAQDEAVTLPQAQAARAVVWEIPAIMKQAV